MTAFEVLNLNRGLLYCLKDAGLRVADVDYVDLYMDYRDMAAKGEKVSYIVAVLAEKYAVSERTVYSSIKRLGADCNCLTVARGGKI